MTRLPRPFPFGPAFDLTLRRLRARAVVLIGGENRFTRKLRKAARKMGVDIISWEGEGDVPDRLINAIRIAARQNPRNLRLTDWGEKIALRAIDTGLPLGLERLRLRKLADLSSLHKALGSPETILCLGSGPSSNDPAVIEAAANVDTIFRVKHRWLKGGVVRRADVSFSGTPETAHKVPGAIILVQDRTAAARLALERSWRGGFRRVSYGIVEDLALGYRSKALDGAKMTNGAAMLATAVALRPKRLIVAGVDLYSHPDGAYPDALDGQNDYAPAHDAATEKIHTIKMIDQQIAQCGRDSLDVIGPLRSIAGLD